jgi:DNA-binding CsgD family transcriptional regulator
VYPPVVNLKERSRDRIARLAARGLDVDRFFLLAGEALTAAVPSAGPACWYTLDPASLLITSSHQEGMVKIPLAVLASEYLDEDFPFKTADVARSPAGLHSASVSSLLKTLRGAAAEAVTEAMPSGVEHFVEVALRGRGGATWGTVTLFRLRGESGFDDEELSFLRSISPHLAEGARRGLLVGEATDPEWPDAPGLVVLGGDWTVESVSSGAERWLADLPGRWEEDQTLPPAVVAVAAQALRTAEHEEGPGEVAVARVLGGSGRWIVLHGAAMVADGARRAAVIVEPAGPARIVPLLMAVYGLTEREQEVTRQVLRGASTEEIAAALYLSPHTVQQHLKSVFGKTGVRSRRELVGKVFFSHYEPRVRDNEGRTLAEKPARGGPFPHRG